ncbi:MAG: hypothetical protein KDK45_07240, partial [Leptospiraceae bacterium]|nr:hypothetical protein [Leptospiraceae bacterium]
MPFSISGNIEKISQEAIRKFSKNFGIIISKGQLKKQQSLLIQKALKGQKDLVSHLKSLSKPELISLVFILSQFGDTRKGEVSSEYLLYENIPYILEWKPGSYMIPSEILEFFSSEKVFRDQNYLFALIPQLTIKEKKAWVKWMEIDYEGNTEWDLNHEIYRNCRLLQLPFRGRSLVQEKEFYLEQLWKPGSNWIVDWFYKGLTTFYYTMSELYRVEKDPFLKHVIENIRAGKLIPKKEPEKFRQKSKFKLVSTVEGNTEQVRQVIYQWETEKENEKNSLFS